MPLGASVYKMVIDTSQLVEGVTVSRRELKLQRDLLESTRGPMERYGDALDNIGNQLRKGLISIEQHNELNRQLKAELPANVAAEKAYSAALMEGEEARRRLATETDHLAESEKRYAAAKEGVLQLQKDGIVGDERAADMLSKLQANSPSVIQAERDRADAINRGRQLQEQWLPVSQRASRELAEVKQHYLAGRVSIDAYRNAQVQLTAAQLTGLPVVGRLAGAVAGMHPAVIATAVGIGVLKAAVDTGAAAFAYSTEKIGEQLEELSKLSNAADNLSLPLDQFIQFSHAADRADLGTEEFAKGFETMLDKVAQASAGKKKPLEAFELIGLDAEKLKRQKPDEILRSVTAGLDGVTDASDRVRAARGIFGDADFLRLNLDDLERAEQLMKSIGLETDAADKKRLSNLEAAGKDLEFVFDGVWKRVAIDLAPALTDLAETATDLLVDVARSETFNATLRETSDLMHGIAAVARGIPDSISLWGNALEKSGIGKVAKLALDIQTLGVFSDIGEIGETNRREQERAQKLDEQLGRKPRSTDSSIRDAGESAREAAKGAESLIEKLNDEIETFGMSSRAAEAYRATQSLVGAEAEAAAKQIADRTAKLDEMDTARRAQQAVDSLSASFEEERQSLRLNAREFLDWKMERDGIEPIIRNQQLAQFDSIQAYKAESKAASDAAESSRRNQEEIANNLARMGEQAQRLSMSERAFLDYSNAQHGATAEQRAAALAAFDTVEAMEKQRDATKLAADKIEELQKKLRQSGMSADERALDDLKVAGVGDEQLKIVATLQRELALREAIHQQVDATSSVLAVGSREAADAISRANQIVVRQDFLKRKLGAPDAIGPSDVGMTATPKPAPPIVSGLKPVIVPPATAEQLKLQQTANQYLKGIFEKELTIQVDEVTL